MKFLIAQQSNRTSVYLTADRCRDGVIEAISNKLAALNDDAFLQSLIYRGAIDVFVDGLNEASPDTRAKIVAFVDQHPSCNVMLSMQPLQWDAPSAARVFDMQPLSPDDIRRFLIEQGNAILTDPSDEAMRAFEGRCNRFCDSQLHGDLLEETVRFNRTVLSNPLDLTIAAELLAAGAVPDVWNLQRQRYDEMNKDYERLNDGEKFPLGDFIDTAYELLLKETGLTLPPTNEPALRSLLKYRMVTRRRVSETDGASFEWRFRHETVTAFFAAKKFMPESNGLPPTHLWERHMSDSRFRGVYLLLATDLSNDDAELLNRLMLEVAVASGDHLLHDEYFARRRTRPRLG